MTVPIDNLKFAFALARAVDLLRKSAEPGEPQKAALRALVNASAERSVTVRFYENTLTIDGEAIGIEDPRLVPFTQRLGSHNVAELVIARGADPNELLALSTGLAQEPGQARIKERLRDAGSSRIMVVTHQAADPGHRPPSVTGAFAKVKMDQAVMTEWNKFLDQGAAKATDRQVDLGMKAPEASANVDAPQGEKQIRFDAPATPPPRYAPGQVGAGAPPPAPPPPSDVMNQTIGLQPSSPLGAALAKVLSSPYSADALTKLTILSRHVEDAFTRDRVAEAIDACNTVIELEARAPDATRNVYAVILKRLLGRAALTQVAPYLLEAKRKARASVVLRRGGEDAVGLLVGLLAAAQSPGERLVYLEVLRGVATGVDRVLALLSRSEWQVVRNTAELAGEARLEEAVPYLARLTEHNDERVCRTAMVALAKIGTAGVVEPLRNAFKKGTPELRAQVVNAVGGAHARPLTAPLASLAEAEENVDVIRACYKALGRIGTAEAKNALEKAASQKVLFSRKAKVAREAAEEVLRGMGA